MRTAILLVVASAGCPASPRSPAPLAPPTIVDPAVVPPWWSKGDSACPSLDIVVPGAAPGSTAQPGHVRRTPTNIYCEAGGVAHGPITRLDPAGRPVETGTMIQGKRIGAWTTFHPDGAIASFGIYNPVGAPTGVWSTWYPSKRLRDRGELFNGVKVGLWQEWDDDGDVARDPDRFIEYDDESHPVMHGEYREGTPLEVLPVCAVGIAYPGCRFIPLAEFGLREGLDEPTPTRGVK